MSPDMTQGVNTPTPQSLDKEKKQREPGHESVSMLPVGKQTRCTFYLNFICASNCLEKRSIPHEISSRHQLLLGFPYVFGVSRANPRWPGIYQATGSSVSGHR